MIGSSNAVIKTGGGAPLELSTTGIDFIDYDGTVLAHYDSVPTTLPTAPTIEGLDFQEWNWTIADLQEYFTAVPNGYVCVGATRKPSDGKTHIFIDLPYSINLGIRLERSSTEASGTVDWGDGTIEQFTFGSNNVTTNTHLYPESGGYEVVLSVNSGEVVYYNAAGGNASILYKVDSGNQYAMTFVSDIWFGNEIPFVYVSSSDYHYAISYSPNLKTVILPNGLFVDNTVRLLFTSSGYPLKAVVFPRDVFSLENVFQNTQTPAIISVPPTITNYKNRALSNAENLKSVYVNSVVEEIAQSAFSSCVTLKSAYIYNNILTLGDSVFNSCFCLDTVKLPDSLVSISTGAFSSCISLPSITIPPNVSSIGSSAFNACRVLKEVHLQPTTPPTLSNVNAFTNTPSDMVIYVPQGTLEAYQQATNWTTYASQMQEEA